MDDKEWGPDTREEVCEICHGKGILYISNWKNEILDSLTCQACNGSGYVEVNKLTREEYAERYPR